VCVRALGARGGCALRGEGSGRCTKPPQLSRRQCPQAGHGERITVVRRGSQAAACRVRLRIGAAVEQVRVYVVCTQMQHASMYAWLLLHEQHASACWGCGERHAQVCKPRYWWLRPNRWGMGSPLIVSHNDTCERLSSCLRGVQCAGMLHATGMLNPP
jgi:hypothetical protein